jgi:hypothetical protein
MTTPLHKQLTHKLRPVRDSQRWYATVTLTLPASISAAAPRWTPGPGYVQARAATVYVRPTETGAHTVIVEQFTPGCSPAMLTGELSTAQLLGVDGVLRRLLAATMLPLSRQELPDDHPAVVYQQWVGGIRDQVTAILPRPEYGHDTAARVGLLRDGRFQIAAAIGVKIDAGWSERVVGAAAALTRAADQFGGATVALFPGITGHLSDPILHYAWRRLVRA